MHENEALVEGIEVARGGSVGAGYGTLVAATARPCKHVCERERDREREIGRERDREREREIMHYSETLVNSTTQTFE